jgi:TolB protein
MRKTVAYWFTLGAAMMLLAFAGIPTAYAQSKPLGLAYQLTHADIGEPFPSPDGKRILYLMEIEGRYQIFTMTVDGSHRVQITHDAANHDSPSWSPDGNKIAFVSDKNRHEVIYMMNLDGSGKEQLTSESADSIHPMWSGDSSQVIYCADDDLHPPKKNAAAIYAVDVDTKRVSTLISGGTNTYPSWSPDGKKIVFRRMIGDMNSEVFVSNSDGTGEQNLSNHPAFDGWPAWSPDGKQIAFSSNRRANYQIHVMNADGTNVRLLANTEGRATEPRWSVDGKTIYFTNCQKVGFGTDCQIMVADAPLR